jgi:hypothetical protein
VIAERRSAQRKTDLALRLLRGEDLGEVSRETHVPRMSPNPGDGSPVSVETGVWGLSAVALDVLRAPGGKRGPKTRWSDGGVLEAIREVLRTSQFPGERHPKVRVRLRHRGLGVGKNRMLRRMRFHGLLVPVRRRDST